MDSCLVEKSISSKYDGSRFVQDSDQILFLTSIAFILGMLPCMMTVSIN